MNLISFLFFYFLLTLPLCANQQVNSVNSHINTKAKKAFASERDKIVSGGYCSWECRDVNNGYATQITGFDFRNGKTFCKVFESSNLDQDLGIDASRINTACVAKVSASDTAEYNQLSTGASNNVNTQSSISYTKDDRNITFTKFLTSLVTLNPSIIDRTQTNALGQITLKDGIELYSITNLVRGKWSSDLSWQAQGANAELAIKKLLENSTLQKEITPANTTTTSYDKTSALDGFNKNNMGYFSDLFLANEKIYQHLQIFLFVLVGGFFVTQIGASKLQTYLENRGESGGKQPYLHKFYIPLLMVGTFFMPIPEANGMAHSTIMQNVIRYFTIHSTNLADMANSIGAKTYMDKIYKSLGGIDNDGLQILLTNKIQNDHIIKEGNEIYKKTCMARYEDKLGSYNVNSLNFMTMSDQDKEDFRNRYTKYDVNGIAGTKNDISFESCIYLEVQIREAERQNDKINAQLQGMRNFQNNHSKKLNEIDKYFAVRDKQLGWVDSILVPSSAILVETFVFEDDHAVKYDMKESTKSNAKNTQSALQGGDVSAGSDDISDSWLGFIAGKLVWMMLPGATAIKDFAIENSGKLGAFAGALVGGTTSPVGSVIGGIIGSTIGKFAGTIGGYVLAITMMEWTFEKVPLLVCTTASLVAFVSYLVSLCKYFYVSPFVVAFSMATKKMDKIVEFLISGIAIFLKPVLIVLFIYLALFVHTLIDELFVFLSVEQFTGIQTSFYNFYTNFVVGAITGLLVIFGKLASSYIMWKLIVSGPTWALSLVGIDGKQDDVIASGLEANLAKRAFVA